MQLNPYLFFDGNCEEAFRFYEKTLGGKIEAMMHTEEAPTDAQCAMGDSMKVAVKPAVAPNGMMLTAPVKAKLMAGTYTVSWHAVATDDGHRTNGTYSFSVK